MKIALASKLNALGFENSLQRTLYAALQLLAGTNPSKKKTLVPAIAANAAATPPVLASPEISSVAVTPESKFIGSVKIDDMPSYIKVEVYLPYSPAAIAKGVVLSEKTIDESTPAALSIGDWIGEPASATAGNESLTNITTVEQFFYREAYLALADIQANEPEGIPTSMIYKKLFYPPNPSLPAIPCVYFLMYLPKRSGNYSYLGSVSTDPSGNTLFGT
jgi:hypothetical protein